MSRAKHGERVMRNRVNAVSGWLLGFGLLAFVVLLDPLGGYKTWPDGGNGLTSENLQIGAFFAALSVGGFSVFARPHVQLRQDEVVICNVLRDVFIPRDAIEAVDTTGEYVRIAAGGKHYTAAGLEQSNLSHWTGGSFGSRAEQAMQPTGLATRERAVVQVRWRRLGVPEVVLLVLWALYTALGIVTA